MALQLMNNVGIVVESLDAAVDFFTELGLTLEGRATIEGDWAGRVTELSFQRECLRGIACLAATVLAAALVA